MILKDIVINKKLIHNNVNLYNSNIDICIDPLRYKPDYPDININIDDYGHNNDDDEKLPQQNYVYGRMRRFSSLDLIQLPLSLNKNKKENKQNKQYKELIPIDS